MAVARARPWPVRPDLQILLRNEAEVQQVSNLQNVLSVKSIAINCAPTRSHWHSVSRSASGLRLPLAVAVSESLAKQVCTSLRLPPVPTAAVSSSCITSNCIITTLAVLQLEVVPAY